MTPDDMIEAALSADDESVCYGQELYAAFLNDYPISNLRKLLVSENDEAVGLGAYLVYELGWLAHPLVDEIADLLHHKHEQVRSDAVLALLECTTRADAEILGRAFLLLDDPDPFVHRAVIKFIGLSDYRQLATAIHEAAKARPGSVFETAISTSFRSPSFDKHTLAELVSHDDPVVRRFAAGMSRRPRMIIDEEFLEVGEHCHDGEGVFAIESVRERVTPNYAIRGRLLYGKNSSRTQRQKRIENLDFSELMACVDEICLTQREILIPKLLELDRGVFHPCDTIIERDEVPCSNIEIAWLDVEKEPIWDVGWVHIIFRDARSMETSYAVFNLTSL